jgi:hypothetical protein
MPILLTQASAAMLADFLEKEFLKRRGQDPYFDLVIWAKEIGIPYNTLRAMMQNRSKDPRINRRNLALLLQYFGPPLLEAIGTPLPEKPSNPMYSPPVATGLSVAEKRDQTYGVKKEGK